MCQNRKGFFKSNCYFGKISGQFNKAYLQGTTTRRRMSTLFQVKAASGLNVSLTFTFNLLIPVFLK